ncbi:DUF6192 family protein [Streptomyces sp. SDr-06]|uniref:DUF6192 family protein n=1 Tax=Streptomyces sp. SDr-06 TaxID=2267702 RepID=UPI001CB99D97
MGWTPDTPVTLEEKVEAIQEITGDDEAVAAAVATDFLRRPEVAFKRRSVRTSRRARWRPRRSLDSMPLRAIRPGSKMHVLSDRSARSVRTCAVGPDDCQPVPSTSR